MPKGFPASKGDRRLAVQVERQFPGLGNLLDHLRRGDAFAGNRVVIHRQLVVLRGRFGRLENFVDCGLDQVVLGANRADDGVGRHSRRAKLRFSMRSP